MALTIFDYRLVITGVVNGVECKNVFWYKDTGEDGDATDLQIAFVAGILPAIADVQSSNFDWTHIDIYNLVDVTNFVTTPLSMSGTRTTAVMPNFVAWYIRYFRTNTLVRNGRKAIAGVAEADVTDGVAIASAVTALGVLTDLLQNPITGVGGTEYTPCIAKTEEYVNPTTGNKYYIPETLYAVNQVQYVKVSTQNSRKR